MFALKQLMPYLFIQFYFTTNNKQISHVNSSWFTARSHTLKIKSFSCSLADVYLPNLSPSRAIHPPANLFTIKYFYWTLQIVSAPVHLLQSNKTSVTQFKSANVINDQLKGDFTKKIIVLSIFPWSLNW